MNIPITCEITDEKIRINGSCTNFLDARPAKLISFESFVNDLAKLRGVCKFNKVKLNQERAAALVKDYGIYLEEIRQVNRLYSELKTMAETIALEGISAPTVDNLLLKEASDIQNKMNSFFFRSRMPSKVAETYGNIQVYLRTGVAGYDKIWI